MAFLNSDLSKIYDLQVMAGADEVFVDVGAPAAVEMYISDGDDVDHVLRRLNLHSAERLLKLIRSAIPVSFSLNSAVVEIVEECERSRFVRDLEHSISVARRTVLEIDSPIALLKPLQQQRGEWFCTWPARYGGQFKDRFTIYTESAREVVSYEFISEEMPSCVRDAFNYTLDFFASRWPDSCIGEPVVVTIRNADREVERREQIIGELHSEGNVTTSG